MTNNSDDLEIGEPYRAPDQRDGFHDKVSDDLLEYQKTAKKTNKLPAKNLVRTLLLGLHGEVGSLVSAIKKKTRDRGGFLSYLDEVTEELGDALWYFTILLDSLSIRLVDLSSKNPFPPGTPRTFTGIQSSTKDHSADLDMRALEISGLTGDLVNKVKTHSIDGNKDEIYIIAAKFLHALCFMASGAGISIKEAASKNVDKIYDRWPVDKVYPKPLDSDFPDYERLPRRIEMHFVQRTISPDKTGVYVVQICNGIPIGDRLTDNQETDDGYRFHDVFHLSYAAILGWSPVIRALFKCKRKSRPLIDEVQDGARAIIIEEGISLWCFTRALQHELFVDITDRIDFDLLKSVRNITRGLEVERCHLWQWEKAIIDGFSVFRDVRRNNGGIVVADLDNHEIRYEGKCP